MTKWVKIIDGVVDTVAMDQPGHFETVINTVQGEGDQPSTQSESRVFVLDLSYVQAADDVYGGYAFDGKKYTAPPKPAPTSANVNTERARREQYGCVVTVVGAGSIALEGNDKAMRNLQGLAFSASLRAAQGDTTTITVFRDANNVNHSLVPMQIVSLWSKGAAYLSDVYQASWVIKALTPIPVDYASNARWPSYE